MTGKYFPLTKKYFSLTNFLNGKQTQESLESDFPETSFRKTSTTLISLPKSHIWQVNPG
jgi:hypothetical protein